MSKNDLVVVEQVEIIASEDPKPDVKPEVESAFTKDTSEVHRLSWNVAHLIDLKEQGKIDFDNPVQRGYVWPPKKKSMLVRSVLKGIPTAGYYFNLRASDKVYECIEGKQRTDALWGFIIGSYSLHPSTPPIVVNGKEVSLARRSYNQLDKTLQNRLNMYAIEAHSFDDMSVDERVEFFTLINSGKPVTPTEISRIRVKSRKVFLKLTEHTAIRSIVRQKEIRSGADEDYIENIWILCNTETPSLLNKSRSPLLASTEVTKEQEKELNKALGYITELCKTAQKNKKMFSRMQQKTHIESIGYMAVMAIRNNIAVGDYVEKVCNFFKADGRASTISERYNAAAGAGTAKPNVVAIRLEELNKVLGI